MPEKRTAVFTINDIDLRIAPESLSVQKEDLVYNWRTLRTSQSTKIPSGHGQALIQARIPFKDSDILSLHRLIVEFRHSPFCYIENLWLRQDLCPEWPLSQKMAFTLTGLDIVPYPETSDAWILNLEFSWFNYFPYLHNWLYRREWCTDWLSSEGSKAEPYEMKLTIGWNINENGERSGPRLNILEERVAQSEAIPEWSTLQNQYTDKALTIDDLEILHRGEIFDLLPMPGKMQQAFFVPQPSESLIYKRYINFLQRDALKKNFDIDLDLILNYQEGTSNTDLYKVLFNVLKASSVDYVVGLHQITLPVELRSLQAEWSELHGLIRSQMLQYKPGVEFAYATYKSVQLPSNLALATQSIVSRAKQSVVPAAETKTADQFWIYSSNNDRRARIRRGLSEPVGFHTPVGNFTENSKRDFDTLVQTINDDIHWRNQNQGVSGRAAGFHWGLDIASDLKNRGASGVPVYAVKAGRILSVETGESNSPLKRWRCVEIGDNGSGSFSSLEMQGAVLEDFLASAEYYLNGDTDRKPVGTVIKSISNSYRAFYVDFGTGGRYVEMSHNNDRERSRYVHLAWINPEVLGIRAGGGLITEEQVKQGFIIGTIGESYTLNLSYVEEQIFKSKTDKIFIPTYAQPTDSADDIDYAKISPHLHFEYYERADFHPERNAASDSELPIVESSAARGYVVVDCVPTFRYAAQQGFKNYIDTISEKPVATIERVADQAIIDPNIANVDKDTIINILDEMYKLGYFYYDRQSDVTNVWWKPWRVSIQSTNEELPEYGEIIKTDSVVLTNCSAGLRHIVASIPILGHEFPTHQHLGSIEPYYNLEFHLLDDSNTLEGIGESGGILSGMRFLLQHNARKFRAIPDSWCLLTDCFLTRLIGTFRVADLRVAFDEDDSSIVTDFTIDRRTIIARAQLETVEGNPGLSRMVFELQETNPYSDEALEINAPKKVKVDEAREKILKAIYNLDFIDKYKDYAIKVLIAQLAGANTAMPGDSNFGKFTLGRASVIGQLDTPTMNNPVAYITEYSAFALQEAYKNTVSSYNTAARLQHGEELDIGNVYIIQDDNKALIQGLQQLGVPVVSFNGDITGSNASNDYVALSEQAVQLDSYIVEKTDTYTVYDISSLLNQSQDTLLLGEIPIAKIQQLAVALRGIITSADMYLAEDSQLLQYGSFSGETLTTQMVVESLYNLPINPRLFRTFQHYLIETGAYAYWPQLIDLGFTVSPETLATARQNFSSYKEVVHHALEVNENWLVWKPDFLLPESVFSNISVSGNIKGAFDVLTTVATPVISLVLSQLERFFEASKNAGRTISALTSGDIPQLQSFWANQYRSASLNIADDIADHYVNQLPILTLAASEHVKDIIEDSVFGNLFGGLTGDSDRLPAIGNTESNLTASVLSCGHFAPHPFNSNFPFFLENSEIVNQANSAEYDYLVNNAGTKNIADLITTDPSQTYISKPVSYLQATLDSTPGGELLVDLFLTDTERITQSGMKQPGAPFKWYTDKSVELEKVRYFKQLLARVADAALQDPSVLRAFGLESLSFVDRSSIVKGKEAYPDLELPYHPYYGDTYAVYPDFYMWNMYEDGDVFNSNIRREVSAAMGFVLTNCYQSINGLQTGETEDTKNSYKPSRDKMVLDESFDEPVALNIRFNAEGTDGNNNNSFGRGATGFPFYPNAESDSSINDFFNQHTQAATSTQVTATDIALSAQQGTRNTTLVKTSSTARTNLESTVVRSVKITNTEEGVQYPSRLSQDQYVTLQNKVDGITSMFGSRAGYLNQDELPTDISDRLNGTPLEREKQPSHRFDLDSLKLLAENSSHDLFSQKRRLARAYPTFKLYFIEEDEWETRLLNFDDFYSYNAVKDFTVTLSRKNPGDVAVVTLQNVSGILDGTKRDAIVDLDYFSQKPKAKAKGLADTAEMIGTAEEQPFGALVLRPGLNVQLRAGMSNDPDNLSVLINGRVVDVQWNQQGDLAQVTIQSFGTELMQILKGTTANATTDIYYTTHQLLGALLLEPELMHFGRWEFGQLYQIGEAKDARFDFFDYSKEANFGRFEHSSAAVRWFFRHPVVMYGLALGGIALASKLPGAGRLFSRASRWGTRFNFVDKTLSKLSITPKFGRIFNKVLGATGIFGRIGTESLEREIIEESARRGITGLITSGTKVSPAMARNFIQDFAESLAKRAGTIGSKEASVVFGSDLAAATRLRADIIAKELERVALKSADDLTIGRVAKAADELEDEVATQLLKGQWFSDPYSTAGGLSLLKEITPKAASNLVNGATTGVSKLLLGTAATVAVAENILSPVATEIYEATIGRVKKYFQAAKISLMLSPQDDNLFPPHPKDYMLIGQGTWEKFKKWFAFTTSSAITGSEEVGNLVKHYFGDPDPFDKRAPVESYQYTLVNSYIWDVLHEMSLRHPGWIYGIRPYGKQFRYTLFFGVPSQRYWAVPADNSFIARANKVARFLEKDVTADEYRSLYGNTIEGIDVDSFDTKLRLEAHVNSYTPENKIDHQVYSEKLAALRKYSYTAKALQEYLKALNLRFIPFRRYHSISSEVDLIWNGIIGSENASYNAVDVTYFSEEPDSENIGPEGSTIIKAHAFLPESMLRVKPLQPYPNCRGYNMAMRYGMGELLFTLRDMYRGEILTLGNPRIMPWDLVILLDTYNSMVGPIEVEQVVHNFSHETGFITEIKPSAVVLANETSSWPILEAMKLASLAVKNIENDALGITADSFGSVGTFVNWLVDHGPGGNNPDYDDYAKAKMKEIFGEYWDQNTQTFVDKQISDVIFGDRKPGAEAVKKINDSVDGTLGAVAGVGYISAITSIGLGYVAMKNKLPFGKQALFSSKATRGATGLAAVAGLGAGGVAIVADALIDPPQLVSLLGGSLLMLQCLRGDTVMVVPLMKNGYPIVAGLNYHDPSMIWNNFLGNLGRFVDDILDGSRDLADLWSIYGMYAWRRMPSWDQITTDSSGIVQGANLTGE